MALEELRGGDESARPQLEAARERISPACATRSTSELAALFGRYDAAPRSRDVLARFAAF